MRCSAESLVAVNAGWTRGPPRASGPADRVVRARAQRSKAVPRPQSRADSSTSAAAAASWTATPTDL